MRKGRLELWLGIGCVGLVLAVGLAGLYHRHVQALYYRWRFLHGEKTAAREAARWLEQRSDGSGGGKAEMQAALAWLAGHAVAEPDPPIVTPHRVLDPGETAEFWVGPAR